MFHRDRPLRLTGCLLALLALVGLLGRPPLGHALPPSAAFASGSGSDRAVIAALGGTLCHEGGSAPLSPDSPGVPRGMACLLCPVCATTGVTAALAVAAPTVIAPAPTARAGWSIAAAPRAPPAVPILAAPPRGPPVLI